MSQALPPTQPSPTTRVAPKRSTFRWYMSGQFIWFISAGLQFVALQTLGALVLKLTPTELGIVQATFLLPALLLMLPAGVAVERNDGRMLLLWLQCAASLPSLALGVMVLLGALDFTGLMIYAVLAGSLNAFTLPVRDTLISHIVVPSLVQPAVGLASTLQFAGNMLGMILVGLAVFFDLGYILLGHVVIVLLAAWTTKKLPLDLVPPPVFSHDNLLDKRRKQMMDGLRFAVLDKKILPVLVMMLAMSSFYWGTFFVFFPLLVRDYYQGGADDVAIINGLFWAGMMVSAFCLTRIGYIEKLGRLVAIGVLIGLAVLFGLSIPGADFWVWSLVFIWGLGIGLFMTSTRTIVQTRAPADYRGRVLSIYQLAFMGGFPFGALAFGWLAGSAPNLHATPFAPLIGMSIVFAFVCFFSPLLSIKLNKTGEIN